MPGLGIVLWHHDQIDREALIRFAQEAERGGLDALWIPETWVRDASVQLAVAAVSTKTIRLGSGIFNLSSRSPGQLAQTAAELDNLSDGRFSLGIGLSGPAVIENWHSQPFERPLLRSRETIAVLRMALAGDRVNFEGKSIQMKGFRLRRKPIQENLPIFLAANGPANTRLCGEVADGWIPYFVPFSRFQEAIAPLAEGAAKAGRSLSEIEVAPFIQIAIDDDIDRARSMVKPTIAFYVGAMGDYYHAQLSRWEFSIIADQIRSAWQAGGRASAAAAVSDELVDELAICGPFSKCSEAIARIREAGVTHPILRLPDAMDEQEALRSLSLICQLPK